MKISLNWLRRFVDISDTIDNLMSVFIKIGFEIESVERKGLDKNEFIVVGEIINFNQHPNADRLRVCDVDIGNNTIQQIVCGASNFKKNDYVVVALPGAILPGGIKIKKSKLRGVESEGMMCSSRELGLGDDHSGIMILDRDCKLGEKVHNIFTDSDVVFKIELTANRGDALCHYGIARELAAWYDIPLKQISEPEINFTNTNEIAPIDIQLESKNCEFYSALILKNIKISESVDWIRRDLESIGVSTVNNIVDLTNWIMLSYGQPLHAFDREKIGSKIIVKQAQNKEKISTLDGKVHELDSSVLLICDENNPLAIAGVIGGSDSKIHENTKNIVLEGASFVADNIRKSSRKLNISTDSSYRYARIVDAVQTEKFLKIAALMMKDLYGAEIISPICIKKNIELLESKKIELNPQFVRSIFGFEISDDEIENILKRLQYKVFRSSKTLWVIESPSYRFDVIRPIDLVEECLRIYGVDKIPEKEADIKIFRKNSIKTSKKRSDILHFLTNNGFTECYNYSLGQSNGEALAIENPLLEDQVCIRTSLIPGLVENFKHNLRNDCRDSRICEFGHIVKKCSVNTFEELISVAFLIPLESREEHWEKFQQPTFFYAKNLLNHIWNLISCEDFDPVISFSNELFQENFSAKIGNLSSLGIEGNVGYLKSDIVKTFKMPIIVGEIFTKFREFENEIFQKKYKSFSTFPSAKRDISLIVSKDYQAQYVVDEVRKIINRIAKDIFSEVDITIFDIYTGGNIDSGHKSVGLNLVFKKYNSTPSDKEIDIVFENLVSEINQHSDFSLRN